MTLRAPDRPARRARRRRGHALFALFAFPNLALIAVFAYWPILANLYLSLTSWDFISPEPLFVGLTNYTSMLASPSFHKVLWVSVVWVVVVVGISLVLGVLLALLFSRKLPGTSAVTGIVFTPHVVSGAAIAVVWLFIFDPNYGLARVVFEAFGAESPDWTTDADWALPALLIVAIWKGVGFVSIVYLAGIQGLPTDVLEAARLDGAGPVQTFLSSGQASVDWTLGSGYVPCTKAAVESEEIAQRSAEDPRYQVAIDQLAIAQGPDIARRFVPEMIVEAKNAIQSVYSAGEDAEKVLTRMEKELEPAVDRVREKYEQRVGE